MLDQFDEVQVVLPHEVQNLTQQGWRLIEIVRVETIEHLAKNLAFQTNPGSYPSTFSYTEDEKIATMKFVMGRPKEIVDNELRTAVQNLTIQLSDSDNRVREHEDSLRKVQSELAKTRAELEQEKVNYLKRTNECNEWASKRNALQKEYDDLKKGVLETIVKLPGLNEASLKEVEGMIKVEGLLSKES